MILDLLLWWALLAVLGLGFLPVAYRIFPASFPDRGRAFAKPLALIALTYASWLLASAGVSYRAALAIAALALAVIGVVAWRRFAGEWRSPWLRDEAIFFAVLSLFAGVRSLAAGRVRRREVHGLRLLQHVDSNRSPASAGSVDERRADQLLLFRLSVARQPRAADGRRSGRRLQSLARHRWRGDLRRRGFDRRVHLATRLGRSSRRRRAGLHRQPRRRAPIADRAEGSLRVRLLAPEPRRPEHDQRVPLLQPVSRRPPPARDRLDHQRELDRRCAGDILGGERGAPAALEPTEPRPPDLAARRAGAHEPLGRSRLFHADRMSLAAPALGREPPLPRGADRRRPRRRARRRDDASLPAVHPEVPGSVSRRRPGSRAHGGRTLPHRFRVPALAGRRPSRTRERRGARRRPARSRSRLRLRRSSAWRRSTSPRRARC